LQSIDGNPAKPLPLQTARLPNPVTDQKEIDQNLPVRVVVPDSLKMIERHNFNAEFLMQLALQCGTWCLARIDFAARKLPQIDKCAVIESLGNQDTSLAISQDAGNHLYAVTYSPGDCCPAKLVFSPARICSVTSIAGLAYATPSLTIRS